ncbi:MAG TPA: hypothetical protein VM802_31510 [Chitinophaga sp.]|uniref:hypothetical protein n=1 Tax=Chitinophaga sp. TaxID=1869181 RepID=UPI002C1225E5|nr:hypothetical protein [Chitinophaga sp.]HVI49436.1 hypothetical protein [Chitinophaga sp.]
MLLLISISLLLILTAGVYFVWKVLLRHHRDLQSAQVSLLQQELKNASLTHQLREARERYKELEDEYYDMQYEMAKEVKDPPAGL